jgi:hypothetical protein
MLVMPANIIVMPDLIGHLLIQFFIIIHENSLRTFTEPLSTKHCLLYYERCYPY